MPTWWKDGPLALLTQTINRGLPGSIRDALPDSLRLPGQLGGQINRNRPVRSISDYISYESLFQIRYSQQESQGSPIYCET